MPTDRRDFMAPYVVERLVTEGLQPQLMAMAATLAANEGLTATVPEPEFRYAIPEPENLGASLNVRPMLAVEALSVRFDDQRTAARRGKSTEATRVPGLGVYGADVSLSLFLKAAQLAEARDRRLSVEETSALMVRILLWSAFRIVTRWPQQEAFKKQGLIDLVIPGFSFVPSTAQPVLPDVEGGTMELTLFFG